MMGKTTIHVVLTFFITCNLVLAQEQGIATAWDAPDRAAKVAELIPGRKVGRMTPQNLFADWNRKLIERWVKDHPVKLPPDAAYRELAETAPTDAELLADFPRHVGPVTGHRGEKAKTTHESDYYALLSTCPFCGSAKINLKFDTNNAYHATTGCCGTELYGREQDYPPDYKLRATENVKFKHLDDTEFEAPCTLYTDKNGKVWELYIKTFFDSRRWDQLSKTLQDFAAEYEKTANPLYAHKIAILLDAAADTYYGLPLAKANDYLPLSRADWEAFPRPNVFEQGPRGIWNRRTPQANLGWLHWTREAYLTMPFALSRHDPAFKQVSVAKYGDPETLDRKIRTKLLREVCLTFQSVCSQALLNNYQQACFVELAVTAILAEDKLMTQLYVPAQEVSLYNHGYHDGLLGEGSAGYMKLPRNNLATLMDGKEPWLRLYPKFASEHPFESVVLEAGKELNTTRGCDLEFGDGTVTDFPPTPVFQDGEQKTSLEKRGSRNWADYGLGILRLGGTGQRLELSMIYSPVTGHGAADTLGIECWVDGVPVMRRGGYVPYWFNIGQLDWKKPEFQKLAEIYQPHQLMVVSTAGGHIGWSWNYSHSPMCQNTLMLDGERGPDGRGRTPQGFSEVVTFKGGEAAGQPGSGFQILDVKDHGSWNAMGRQVSEFRRTLIGIEIPEGRAYAIDLTKVRGGREHALFNGAWGDRQQNMLPAVNSTVKDLEQVLIGGKDIGFGTEFSPFRQVKNVDLLNPSNKTWSLTWSTDFTRYAPKPHDGKPFVRPLPGEEGKVRLRLIGFDGKPGPTQLLSARAPWLAVINPKFPRIFPTGVVGFEKGRDFLIERRRAAEGAKELESLFVHVIEGFRDGETSRISVLEPVMVKSLAGTERDMVALRIQLSDGTTDSVIYQSAPGTVRMPDGIETDARYALFRRSPAGHLQQIEACRGSFIRGNGLNHNLGGDLTGTITDVIGDLTGTRTESALILKTEQPWPEGEALKGRQLLVNFTSKQRDEAAEGYRIQKTANLSGGLVRVYLLDHAPFVESWHDVFDFPSDEPGAIRTTRNIAKHANSQWYDGLNVWFPEKNRHYTIKSVSHKFSKGNNSTLTLNGVSDPAKEGIAAGDWFVIYGVRLGLKTNVAGQWRWTATGK